MKAYEAKQGITIKMSRRQLAYNMKIEEGFLPMLAGFIPFLMGNCLTSFMGWGIIGVGELSGLGIYRDWQVRVFKS